MARHILSLAKGRAGLISHPSNDALIDYSSVFRRNLLGLNLDRRGVYA
jgi:hypothetical protein